MAPTSPRRTSPWVFFAAGVVATLTIVLVWWAVGASRRAADIKVVAPMPIPSDLRTPHMPDTPRLPDMPSPNPR